MDERPGTPVNGMVYENTVLGPCWVFMMYFLQSSSSPIRDMVLAIRIPFKLGAYSFDLDIYWLQYICNTGHCAHVIT